VTTPDERTRAILHTKDFLVELLSASQTPRVPESIRSEAHRLLRHYPGVMELDLAHRALPMFFMFFGQAPPNQSGDSLDS
jgi:hypothetical protein